MRPMDPWALITGASTGIGRELARVFAANGFHLALLARNEARLKELAAECERAHPVQTRVLARDLARPDAADEIFDALRDTPVEVLVNNAGFGFYGPFAQSDLRVQTDLMQVNIIALVQLTHRFLEPMIARGHGRVLNVASVAARFDESFLVCLYDPAFRKQLRRVLIARYFLDPGERAALYDLVDLPVPPDDVVKADARLYAESRERGREARFRLTVAPAYNYTCALTGYRCVTTGAGSIVDAAHIHQFADSRNNHPRNGLALSKNAHWMFDAGLWSLDDDYRVIVAKGRFAEAGEDAFLLTRFAGRRIALPCRREYWPDRAQLAWHRGKHELA